MVELQPEGQVELTGGSIAPARADVTQFYSLVRRCHPVGRSGGRKLSYPQLFEAVVRFWEANLTMVKPSIVTDHISTVDADLLAGVPIPTIHRYIVNARALVRRIAIDSDKLDK